MKKKTKSIKPPKEKIMPIKRQIALISTYFSNRDIDVRKGEIADFVSPDLHYDENKSNVLAQVYGGMDGHHITDVEALIDQKVVKKIPKEFNWLVKEAKKYKTAVSFQKAQYKIKPIPQTALGIEMGLIRWNVIPKSKEPHVLRAFWELVHKKENAKPKKKAATKRKKK